MSQACERLHRSHSNRLCLSCGLCCDGSVVAGTELTREDAAHARRIGLTVVALDGSRQGFRHPCPLLQADAACAAYADRPRSCREYRCALLVRYETGHTSLDTALTVVRTAKRLLAAWRAGGARDDAAAGLDAAAADVYLWRHFREPADPPESTS